MAQVTQPGKSQDGIPNILLLSTTLRAKPAEATLAGKGAVPSGSQGRVPPPLPTPNPGCPRLLLLDLQRCHLPLFVELVIEGAHDVGREEREVLLGVHGDSSGSSLELRGSSARGCPGRAGSQGSLRLRAASGTGSWATQPRTHLPRSAAARRLRTKAWTPPPPTSAQLPYGSRDSFPPGAGSDQGATAMLLGSHDSAAASAFRLEDPPLASHAPMLAAVVGHALQGSTSLVSPFA